MLYCSRPCVAAICDWRQCVMRILIMIETKTYKPATKLFSLSHYEIVQCCGVKCKQFPLHKYNIKHIYISSHYEVAIDNPNADMHDVLQASLCR